METKTVWAGLYGGHYDIIVFFKEEPTKKLEHATMGFEFFECDTDLIIGDMALCDFYKCFPNADLRPYTQPREDTTTLGGRPKRN